MTREELIEKIMDVGRNRPAREAASDVVDLCAEEMLGDPDGPLSYLPDILRARRYSYLKPKTLEERVKVLGEDDSPISYRVELDGRHEIGGMRKETAETYRLGVIARERAKESN